MDNLPTWYYSALANKQLMLDLQQTVATHLEGNPDDSVEDVMSVNSIHPIFEGEVEEIMKEWKGQ